MKRAITHKRVIDICNKWFTSNWEKIYTEKPKTYNINIDIDDNILIYVEFNDGDKNCIELGNMYKWLWENNIEG